MNIPAHGKQPHIEIILGRWKIDATTPLDYYLARDFFDKTGQPMKVKDVLLAFEQAESVLLSKYGIEFIYDVAMNPLVLGVNVTEDEYVRKSSDSKFMERMDVSGVLGWIQQYRLEHRTEQAGTGQPVTRPESKSESGDKPQPESERRSR